MYVIAALRGQVLADMASLRAAVAAKVYEGIKDLL